jgi:hypothetical protein
MNHFWPEAEEPFSILTPVPEVLLLPGTVRY